MDEDGLLTLLRLLRLAQPLGKGQLQRLMHNLCANTETREVSIWLMWQCQLVRWYDNTVHNLCANTETREVGAKLMVPPCCTAAAGAKFKLRFVGWCHGMAWD
jgi:hypothetical protein